MGSLPFILGDMRLLKILKEWEVSVNCFKLLTQFSCSATQLQLFPLQIERIAKLTKLDISCNSIVRIPETISKLSQLVHLDLSHNKLMDVPIEIYMLPLQVLHYYYHFIYA